MCYRRHSNILSVVPRLSVDVFELSASHSYNKNSSLTYTTCHDKLFTRVKLALYHPRQKIKCLMRSKVYTEEGGLK